MGSRTETRVWISKLIPANLPEIDMGHYKIRAISSDKTAGGEAILSYDEPPPRKDGPPRAPVVELDLICSLLSLLLDCRVKRDGVKINGVDVLEPSNHDQYPQFLGVVDAGNLDSDTRKVLALDRDLARQFIRASKCYSLALDFIPSDPTFAFFLLITSVECLANQASVISSDEISKDSKCERFCHFIKSYLPMEMRGDDEQNSALLEELLKTAYYVERSGFVHGGREVSPVALMADRAGSSYFKHVVDDKDSKVPGLGWLAGVVRGAMLGFLRRCADAPGESDEELLAHLAMERYTVQLKAAGPIEKWQEVKLDDIEYR